MSDLYQVFEVDDIFTLWLPYINNVIRPHKYLMFKGKKPDGTGTHVFVLRCLMCNQCWELFAWPVFGSLEISHHTLKDHSSP